MEKFIMTQDKDVYHDLTKRGLPLLSQNNGTYIFLNNHKATFSKEAEKKMVFTNKMSL